MNAEKPSPTNAKLLTLIGVLSVIGAVLIAAFIYGRYQDSTRATGSEHSPITTAVVPVGSYSDIVERAAPAVVTIRSERRIRAPRQHPFFPFFGNPFGAPEVPRERVQRGLGSGVIVSSDGYLLTNHHVVDGAEEIKVELSNREAFTARIVGSDPPSDLAVLKVDSAKLPVLQLGDSDQVRVGDVVLALGNPLGLGQTVTAGIISAKGRSTGLSDGSFEDFLQTDAPINRGNSGGALVDTRGQLIGINSQIVSPTGGNIGIGFAIPSNMARNVMDQLRNSGAVRRGWLGVTIQPVTSDIAASLGLGEPRGVLVNSVRPGGAADQAGVRQGDIIVGFDGKAVEDGNSLRNRVATTQPGKQVTLTILRDGKEQQLTATLDEFSTEAARNAQNGGGETQGGRLGVTVQPVTPEIAAQLGIDRNTRGVVVTAVDPAGPAAAADINPGDVISEANRQTIRSPEDLQSAVDQANGRPVLLLVNRRGQTVFVAVRPR
jgi:Do/DeqQ family serine protease